MPSNSAARSLFPPQCVNTWKTCCCDYTCCAAALAVRSGGYYLAWLPKCRLNHRHQMARLNQSAFRQSRRLGDDAFQLTKIVRPEMLLQPERGFFRQHLRGLSGRLCRPPQQPLRQKGNVLNPLPQRRHAYFHCGQMRVEVLAKLPDRSERAQIAVGCNQDPKFDRAPGRGVDASQSRPR